MHINGYSIFELTSHKSMGPFLFKVVMTDKDSILSTNLEYNEFYKICSIY